MVYNAFLARNFVRGEVFCRWKRVVLSSYRGFENIFYFTQTCLCHNPKKVRGYQSSRPLKRPSRYVYYTHSKLFQSVLGFTKQTVGCVSVRTFRSLRLAFWDNHSSLSLLGLPTECEDFRPLRIEQRRNQPFNPSLLDTYFNDIF